MLARRARPGSFSRLLWLWGPPPAVAHDAPTALGSSLLLPWRAEALKNRDSVLPAGWGFGWSSCRARHTAQQLPQNEGKDMVLQLPDGEPIRLVGPEGDHKVLSYGEARSKAAKMGTDLIVVARNAKPPVFKLGEAAKALFQQRRKEKELKRRQLEARRAQAIKEVRIGAKIADHDLDRLLKLAQDFLAKGYKVKVLISFQRRDAELGMERLKLVKQQAEEWATVANPAPNDRVAASTYAVMLTPLPGGGT